MLKKLFFALIFYFTFVSSYANNTYVNAKIANEDFILSIIPVEKPNSFIDNSFIMSITPVERPNFKTIKKQNKNTKKKVINTRKKTIEKKNQTDDKKKEILKSLIKKKREKNEAEENTKKLQNTRELNDLIDKLLSPTVIIKEEKDEKKKNMDNLAKIILLKQRKKEQIKEKQIELLKQQILKEEEEKEKQMILLKEQIKQEEEKKKQIKIELEKQKEEKIKLVLKLKQIKKQMQIERKKQEEQTKLVKEKEKTKKLEELKQKIAKVEKLKALEQEKLKQIEKNKNLITKEKESKQETSIEIVKQIEKNLLSSNITTNKPIELKKAEWNEIDIIDKKEDKEIKQNKNATIVIEKAQPQVNINTLKNKAFSAVSLKEYEIAVKLYKQILEKNKQDNYSKLALATCYQNLKQYGQAKTLYLDLINIFPNNDKIISNLFSIMINDSPYEAVYLLPQLAERFNYSDKIQFQLSIAFSKVKNYTKAVKYMKEAIAIDPTNVVYLYNLAVLYDKMENYPSAQATYKLALKNIETNNNSVLPYNKINNRINELNKIMQKR